MVFLQWSEEEINKWYDIDWSNYDKGNLLGDDWWCIFLDSNLEEEWTYENLYNAIMEDMKNELSVEDINEKYRAVHLRKKSNE